MAVDCNGSKKDCHVWMWLTVFTNSTSLYTVINFWEKYRTSYSVIPHVAFLPNWGTVCQSCSESGMAGTVLCHDKLWCRFIPRNCVMNRSCRKISLKQTLKDLQAKAACKWRLWNLTSHQQSADIGRLRPEERSCSRHCGSPSVPTTCNFATKSVSVTNS